MNDRDRLRAFLDLLLANLDEPVDGASLAGRAYVSRFHFGRLVAAAVGEAPAAFRRRILLERAAWEIQEGTTVTDASSAAGYASPEAFARAFGRVFGSAPSRFRGDFRAPAPNGIHFHPPGGMLVPGDDERRNGMDLIDRLLEHDLAVTRELFDRVATLPAAHLDERLLGDELPLVYEPYPPTLRGGLQRLVFTKEMWAAAIAGRRTRTNGEDGLADLRFRADTAGAELATLIRDVRDRNRWDTAFVDATCEPPESFPFGAVVSHILTLTAHRRETLIKSLRELGVEVESGDPIAWERGAGAI